MIVYSIVASPRKGKNTDLLVDQASAGAKESGAETKKIYIYDLKIKPCPDCDQNPEGHCLINDDMGIIYKMFDTADAVVLGTPVYYGSIPGPMKILIDRCNCINKRIAKHKKCLLIITADRSKRFSQIIQLIRFWGKDVNLEISDLVIVTDTTTQPVEERKALLKLACDKGKILAESLETPQS